MTTQETPDARSPMEQKPEAPPSRDRVAPLFRRIDWLTFGLTFAAVWTVYFLTLAPELTLEDCGELVTGSVYAGIPHPPGYPVWTIYSWLWTVLLPVGNMAWRVEVGEATAAAVACGLLAFMVSRGSSLLMEGIAELKSMTGKWESAICMVSGCVAGLLVGLDGFMWRESVVVNRIALFSVPWFMLVLVCLLRWIYAPQQLRYAYWAAFIFGVCFTTHQSLIVAAIGFEVAIAAGNPRLGRDAFFGNFIIYLIYLLILKFTGQHLFANMAKPGLFFLFNAVGIGSLLAGIWLAVVTRKKPIEYGRDLAVIGAFGYLGCLFLVIIGALPLFNRPASFVMLNAAGLTVLWLAVRLVRQTWHAGREWLTIAILASLWLLGVSFYFYMPLSGMTNPPMQWGYPRTSEGFFHALSRGQYEQPNPTNVIGEPGRFAAQLGMLFDGVAEEFTLVYMFIALVPFLFFFRMQRRERAWLISLAAMYFCLGVLLIILLNPTPDRGSAELIKVFLTSSHTIVGCLVGYGLALTAAFMATHYERFRFWGLAGGIVAVGLALYCLWDATGRNFFGPAGRIALAEWPHWLARAFARNVDGLLVFGNLVLVAIALGFVAAIIVYRRRGPLLIALCLFGAMPLYSLLAHWGVSAQNGHWFGYWFGHDMFTPPFKTTAGQPLYPPMTRDAVLFGGTDPGRFCPTYMIFCESFTPHRCQPAQDRNFDRRDVAIITQNALADGTYLNYIRAHYNRSREQDPPFFREFFRTVFKDKEDHTNLLARAVAPLDRFFTGLGDRVEKRRRTSTSWFKEDDFTNLAALAERLKAGPQQDPVSRYVSSLLGPKTRQLLAGNSQDKTLRRSLVADFNRLLNTKLDPEQFRSAAPSEYLQDFIKQDPQSHARVRLNRLLLEAAYPNEIARSLPGVYPDREIYTPSPEDNSHCFQAYVEDASRRLQHDLQFPNELKQVKPGEDVRLIEDKISVSGTIAVMGINGLLTKVIFDHNPKNEFFLEESFPIDWMYPHLTPFGIIMKINRQPLPALTEDVLQRDHQFWKQYSQRLTGDFIDYGTSVEDVTRWVEKTYLRRDFNGFTGDRKFIRDNDAQKAFSKLRSAIAGVYAWRLGPYCPPQFRPRSEAETQRLAREAEFAFRQAFAFCPYSPEATFHYVNFLAQAGRVEEALLLAKTCLKLDPYSAQVIGAVRNLEAIQKQQGQYSQALENLQQVQERVRTNPSDYPAAFSLASTYLQVQQTDLAVQVLQRVVGQSNPPAEAVLGAAQAFAKLQRWSELETTLEKLVKVQPGSPEAWYDLAAFKATIGKGPEALPPLRQTLILNAERLRQNAKARDLLAQARQDPRFTPLRQLPEFQKLVPPGP